MTPGATPQWRQADHPLGDAQRQRLGIHRAHEPDDHTSRWKLPVRLGRVRPEPAASCIRPPAGIPESGFRAYRRRRGRPCRPQRSQAAAVTGVTPASPDVHRILTVEQGWTTDRYERRIARTLSTLLRTGHRPPASPDNAA